MVTIFKNVTYYGFSKIILIVFILFSTSYCGKNNGSPDPAKKTQEPSGNQEQEAPGDAKPFGETLLLQDGALKMSREWLVGPVMGNEELVLNSFKMQFFSAEDKAITNIKNITVTAWMPEHGHDTGDEKPRAGIDERGLVTVDNIYFIMTGRWEFIVSGIVDDKSVEVRFDVQINE